MDPTTKNQPPRSARSPGSSIKTYKTKKIGKLRPLCAARLCAEINAGVKRFWASRGGEPQYNSRGGRV